MKAENPQGRVDLVALRAFNALALKSSNPAIKLAVAVFAPEIEECLAENLGPGTKAHRVGARLARAFGDHK